jgi:hypothetical protein
MNTYKENQLEIPYYIACPNIKSSGFDMSKECKKQISKIVKKKLQASWIKGPWKTFEVYN